VVRRYAGKGFTPSNIFRVHRQPLPRGVHLEANVLERVTLALDVSEGPSNRGVDGDRLDLIPSVQAAVRGDGVLE